MIREAYGFVKLKVVDGWLSVVKSRRSLSGLDDWLKKIDEVRNLAYQ